MRREARAAARLDHPAVVHVYDVAVVDGRPWRVMELVHGRTLGEVLDEGTLDAREAARVGLEVLGAPEAAHAAGVPHRDVKPDNGEIRNSARSQMYADDEEFRARGEYSLDMPEGANTHPDDTTTYKGREAARDTVTCTTDDSRDPRPRELQVFYYRTRSGDMYKLVVGYPGKGDFTGRGREVARTAIANPEVRKL
ncbi:hypothetical protein Shyhy01_57470 [Streptomyces hygroscopicus subsp. hygroscopicus]|nr:hypothetical protein Shyhy01_57470 [Streptomyces hygroscopicus subsp. hygroscopicus]